LVCEGNRFTAVKAVIGAGQIAGVTAFQLLVEMLTGGGSTRCFHFTRNAAA
jgi:hypothetical protein